MKKIIAIIIIVVCAAGAFFGIRYSVDKNMTDTSNLKTFSHAEFSVKLPKNMKPKSNLYTVSTGEEQIAYYSNTQACFSVSKVPYSVNEYLKRIDLESYYSDLTINGEKLDLLPVNDGFYYLTKDKSSDNFKSTFTIEAVFKGETAIYSVAIQCRENDRYKYEDAMINWLKSFELKD